MVIHEGNVDLDGIRVHYLFAGKSGSPLLLLHGGGTDSAALSWGHLITRFAANHRVFAPDWRGYGESDRPDFQYSFPYYISVLNKLIKALALERSSLVGISMGGAIGLGYTLDHQDSVRRLILVDSYGLQDQAPAHKLSYRFVRLPLVNELTWATVPRSRTMAAYSLRSIFADPKKVTDELVDLVYAELNKPKVGMAFQSFQQSEPRWQGMRTNYMERLEEIHVPTLIIHGEKDALVLLHYAEEAHAGCWNLRCVFSRTPVIGRSVKSQTSFTRLSHHSFEGRLRAARQLV